MDNLLITLKKIAGHFAPLSYKYLIKKRIKQNKKIQKIISVDAYNTSFYTAKIFYKPISKSINREDAN